MRKSERGKREKETLIKKFNIHNLIKFNAARGRHHNKIIENKKEIKEKNRYPKQRYVEILNGPYLREKPYHNGKKEKDI